MSLDKNKLIDVMISLGYEADFDSEQSGVMINGQMIAFDEILFPWEDLDDR